MKHVIAAFFLIAFVSITSVFAQTRQTRNVDTFTKLSFRVPGKLFLRQGSPQKVEIEGNKDILSEIETEVSGGKLVIGKEGKWFDWSWDNDNKVSVYITVKDLDAISVSGSGDLIGETKFTAADMDLNVSGSGSLKIEVDASGIMNVGVSGSGNVDLNGKCRDYASNVSGSGKIVSAVTIGNRAEFTVSGSGRIVASGSANRVRTSVSGSGRVQAGSLVTNSCDVRISGSGDVEIEVRDELEANITGSGSVNYKGSPGKINSHTSGSGRVRKI
jgi:hypothetical protein